MKKTSAGTEYLLYRYIVLTVKGMKNSETYKN